MKNHMLVIYIECWNIPPFTMYSANISSRGIVNYFKLIIIMTR